MNPNSQSSSAVSQTTLQSGSSIKSTPKKKLSSQSKRSFSTGRTLDIMKSPLVKISRVHSKHTAGTVMADSGRSIDRKRKTKSKNIVSVPLSPLTTMMDCTLEKDCHSTDVPLSPTNETGPLTIVTNTSQRTNSGDNTLPSIFRGGDKEQKEDVVSETDEPVEAGSPSAAVSSRRLLRRSPRTTKWRSKMEGMTNSCAELAGGGGSNKKRKKNESLKAVSCVYICMSNLIVSIVPVFL